MSETAENSKAQLATVGGRISVARLRAGFSQRKLAKAVGVSPGAVGQWETNLVDPTAGHLRKVAIILGVASEWLATAQGPTSISRTGPQGMMDIMPEGELIKPDSLGAEISRPLLALIAGKTAEIWKMSLSHIDALGYRPGDYLIVDLKKPANPRDIVLADARGAPIFRVYAPPYLFALSAGVVEPPLVVDPISVIIRGVVVNRFSFS